MALFAVLINATPTGISADEFFERLPKGYAYMKGLIEKGTIKHSWVRIGESGGLNIFDVESHEELLGALYGNPISPHLQFTIYPLVEVDDFSPDEIGG
ncbi:muconolactone Delta-isomerase family protein [Streptomyces sp. NPDC048106]|uniref:muconolactone Delta-isomerase family protein n=1 Tax=Streptomyces sp. NPDC048106 TaxID=3155750 RepID=UPI003456F97F